VNSLPWYQRLEYNFWHTLGFADPNQNPNTTKYFKCVQSCIDSAWDNILEGIVAANSTAHMGLWAAGYPSRYAVNFKLGADGNPEVRRAVSGVTKLAQNAIKGKNLSLAERTLIIKSAQRTGFVMNKVLPWVGVAEFAIQAGCALKCRCAD
jgi:hypothetical protein